MVSSNTSRQSIEACSWAISRSDSGANKWGLLACLRARLIILVSVTIGDLC